MTRLGLADWIGIALALVVLVAVIRDRIDIAASFMTLGCALFIVVRGRGAHWEVCA